MKFLKKMKNKLLIYLILFLFTYSCTGLGSKRSQKSDEFLVEKKNPLVMPPDIGELPSPKDSNNDRNVNSDSDSDFKNILNSKKSQKANSSSNTSNSLKESIIKKIEQ
tara:strand:+ start:1056 stop:1379 length:324 start_codon:yes stop_codon:yes gene_type:complete